MPANRLKLDFSIQTTDGRRDFVSQYVLQPQFQKNPLNESELETIANYILWGKEVFAKHLSSVAHAVAEKRFGNNITRWTNFCNWSKRIPTKHYYGSEELPKKLNEKYDLFFAGSDQIWNYHFSFRGFYNYFFSPTHQIYLLLIHLPNNTSKYKVQSNPLSVFLKPLTTHLY